MATTTAKSDALTDALLAVQKLRARVESLEKARSEPIAIVGLSCRYPEAPDADAFWQLLRDGRDAIREVPPDRWDLGALYAADPDAAGKMYTRHGGFVAGLDQFDALFFGIAPREAISLDPQQRLLLEGSWEALENAGLAPDQLAGSRTGVYFGISNNDYMVTLIQRGYAAVDAYLATGTAHSTAAGRVSYFLGLEGPCFAIDTACSSSLVAVHEACQALRAGECDLALAGGVNVLLQPILSINFCRARMLSVDGHCWTFDAAANGYARGEGCGVIVLKRLDDARRDGDRILALLRGSAVNQDGRSSGLTVPNGPAQQRVIQAALKQAGIAPAAVQYAEAHGTATPLGDPIEVQALAAALGEGRPADRPLWIGSVKTNIGHLEAGAGLSGLIKVVLSLQHEELPAHLHLRKPNPNIPWERLPVEIVRERRPWPRGQGRRIAGVSGFGFGGTNAHVVLEEAPLPPRAAAAPAPRSHQVLVLSGKNEAARRAAASQFADWLGQHPNADLAEVCFTAAVGRAQFEHRAAVVADSVQACRVALAALAEDRAAPGLVRGQVKAKPRMAWLFTGQGSQYAGMAKELYDTQPVFRTALDRCAAVLDDLLDEPLLSVLFATDRPGLLDQTGFTQPALFAVEMVLAELWQSWGLAPDVVIGHSVGEYAAACVAGVFSLEDGLRLMACRGRLMQALPAGGGMAAILAPAEQVTAIIATDPRLAIAAYNGANTVVSGPLPALEAVLNQLSAEGIKSQRLATSHAFHSSQLEPMLEEFEDFACRIRIRPAQIPLLSNLTGRPVEDGALLDAAYWRRHARQPVQFARSVQALAEMGCSLLLEVGPSPVLLGMAQRCWPEGAPPPMAVPTLRRGRADTLQLCEAVAQLHVQGIKLDFAAWDRPWARSKLALPTYPFQRQRYWVEPSNGWATSPPADEDHSLLGKPCRRAGSSGQAFERQLAGTRPAWLGDHRVFDLVIFPGAGYVELALAAAEQTGSTAAVGSLMMHAPLLVPAEGARWLQTVTTPEEHGGSRVEIFSQGAEENTWTLHATAQLSAAAPPSPARPLAELQARCTDVRDVGPFYANLTECGLDYGTAFQTIRALHVGAGELLARIELAADLQADRYRLHPSLLDGCLQALATLLPAADAGGVFLPMYIERLQLEVSSCRACWCHAQLREGTGDKRLADLTLFDDVGKVVATVTGLTLSRVDSARLRQATTGKQVANLLYRIAWQRTNRPERRPTPATGPWLLFGDVNGIGSDLAQRLQTEGVTCILVRTGSAFAAESNTRYLLDPTDRQHFTRLLDALISGIGAPRGVVYLGDRADEEELATRLKKSCGGLLHLVQVLLERGIETLDTFAVVTHGSQALDAAEMVDPAHTALWGLGRVLASEQPGFRAALVDLELSGCSAAVDALVAEVLAADEELERVLRGGIRYAARLRPAAQVPRLTYPNEHWQLQPRRRGALDELTLMPTTAGPPSTGEAQVRVQAAGLNFRDVLNALGMYPGDPGPLGGECAGEVIAVGPGVTELAVGDAVFGLCAGAMAQTASTPAALLVRKPSILSDVDAAGLPITFCTSFLAFQWANLQPGERVLIHAGAGGVGLAAIQLARVRGAEVFATASEAKQPYLRSLGVRHVFNSRDCRFAADIRAATGGAGVQVILNSLTGEGFIPASLEVLAPGGRFVEIGKRGIWSSEQMATARPDARYLILALDDLMQQAPARVHEVLSAVADLFAAGKLQPPHRTVYPLAEARTAFRVMQQARHIGKIVLQMPANGRPRAEATYLITGGLGAVGLELAQGIVQQGARHLVLTSRRPPGEAATKVVEQLREKGCTVRIVKADVGQEHEVQRLLATVAAEGPPLRGVIHAAGVLDDGMLRQLNWDRVQAVLAPKALGAWYLHQLTRSLPLDFFVCTSSVASVLGSMGQGNYAAANAFLDGLAQQRTAQGLPATSINWGPWADRGMAAVTEQGQRLWKSQGITPLAVETALAAHTLLLDQHVIQAVVLDIDWTRFTRAAGDRRPPLLSERMVAREARSVAGPSPLDRLRGANAPQRGELVLEHLREESRQVLGLAQPIAADSAYQELGLDSLMAVELRNRLQKQLQIDVPVSQFFEGVTVRKLAEQLTQQLAAQASPAQPGANDQAPAPADQRPIDWDEELCLDADIQLPAGADPAAWRAAAAAPRRVLLTGATGFLGTHLLHELLQQTRAEVVCLVRCRDVDEGLARLREGLRLYELESSFDPRRIVVLPGDLEQPRLGLDSATWEEWAQAIDVVYHNAAWLHFHFGYRRLRASNVGSTRELLRFACHSRVKPYHHVSTVAVHSRPSADREAVVRETDLPAHPVLLENGYAQSKAVAEHLVAAAGARGLPVAMYRPEAIGASSTTGACTVQDISVRFIKTWIILGQAPPVRPPIYEHLELNAAPVDYVARALVHLSLRPETLGQTLHLVNPHALTMDTLIDMVSAAGYPVTQVSVAQWREQLAAQAARTQDRDLNAVLPFIAAMNEPQKSDRRTVRIDSALTEARLAGTGIHCPRLDVAQLRSCLQYFERVGFLKMTSTGEHVAHD